MILAKLNQPEFEYDIHSLIKAFYPNQNVSATAEGKEYNEEIIWRLDIDYAQDKIGIVLSEQVSEFCDECADNECSIDAQASTIDVIFEEKMAVQFVVDFSDRSETKNRLKQHLYLMLKQYSGKELPWGTLTGIRPTKIPMKFLEEGKSREEIEQYMKEAYFVSSEKIDLSIDIAERELKLLQKIDYENGYSLYIGIPFCPTTCLYCSFTSYPLSAWRSRVDAYLDALEKEIQFVSVKFYHKKLNSIYIGGGTPTTLEPHQLDRLIRFIKCHFDLSHCVEFTVEAGRPDSITREKLEVLYKWGVDRISINPQTMKDETLRLIGRHHTVEQTIECYKIAREVGFDNINMDLILGLPGESLEDVHDTMEQIKELNPDNLTVHSLALKRAARLNMFKDDYKDYKMVNTQEHMDLVSSYCKELDLKPYYLYRQKSMAGNLENVGYAKSGKAGVYNILIMEEKQTIMAIGAGTVTKRVFPDGRIERVDSVKDVGLYIDRIDEMIGRKKELLIEYC
ncbi:MAG: coproporphyrinogen dehydrogenase HemZ [Roseburia sp.]|nr:coproporphyrinogen dehydrogenase HemZ [Roseburia sp.]